MSHTLSEAESAHVSLTQILAIFGDEVQKLGRTVEILQTVLSPAILHIASDPDCHMQAQTLDLLSQRLKALGLFVSSLEHSVPREWWVDFAAALRGVTLSDLGWQLKGRKSTDPDHEAGMLEMF